MSRRDVAPLQHRRARALLVGLIAFSSASALAQPATNAEVEFLLGRVERSGCAFVRNGSAHPPEEAVSHLRRKLAAARRVLSAEQFIEHVASKSSMSGDPYWIRCAGKPDEQAGPWLRRALQERNG